MPAKPIAAHGDGYRSTAELVSAIRAIAPFEVSVSAYPEKHPDSPSLEWDIDILKAKIDAGATRAITQFAFDNDAVRRASAIARRRPASMCRSCRG